MIAAAAALSLSEEQSLEALRSFIQGLIGSAIEVIVGQDNRVPAPRSANYVVMTSMLRTMLATNTTTFHDGTLDDVPTAGIRMDLMPADVAIQCDIHGAASMDIATTIQGMFRTDYACDAFELSGFDVTPLYASEPHQSAFSNGEQQTENCWILDLHVQCNPVVTTPQQFADTLTLGIKSVDATYPPT